MKAIFSNSSSIYWLTNGKEYEILKEEDERYLIADDRGHKHWYSFHLFKSPNLPTPKIKGYAAPFKMMYDNIQKGDIAEWVEETKTYVCNGYEFPTEWVEKEWTPVEEDVKEEVDSEYTRGWKDGYMKALLEETKRDELIEAYRELVKRILDEQPNGYMEDIQSIRTRINTLESEVKGKDVN